MKVYTAEGGGGGVLTACSSIFEKKTKKRSCTIYKTFPENPFGK